MDDDKAERARVYSKIAPLITAFAHETGEQPFHAEELRQYVLARTSGIAPSSPDRILRDMRTNGILDYEVTNRRQSLYRFHNGESEMNEAVVKPSELVAQYIQLRDAKDAATQKYKDFCATHFGGPMEEIEMKLLKLFNDLGVDNLNARGIGTAYRLTQVSVTIADPREFRRHVIGNEQWDLADWRASKTAINDLVEKGEPLPPGINRVARYTIGIRRS